jgi:N-acetylneuraminate lyase
MEMLECITMKNGNLIFYMDRMKRCWRATMGAKAAIGTTYNFMSPVFNTVIDRFKKGEAEEALKIQTKINQVIHVLLSTGSAISGGKAMMKMAGLIVAPVVSRFQH